MRSDLHVGAVRRAALAATLLPLLLGPVQSVAQTEPAAPVVRSNGKAQDLQLGGFVQVQGEFGQKGDSRFTTGNDRFYLRRARLNLTGKLRDDFDFKFELDASGSLKETSDMRTAVTDAYVNWTHCAQVRLRAGQFKTPFGMEWLYADPRMPTIERTLMTERLTLNRQLGVQLWGDPVEKRLSYAAGMFNGTPANSDRNDGETFLFAWRVAVVPWQGTIGGKDGKWSVAADGYSDRAANLTDMPAEFGFNSSGGGAPDKVFQGDRMAWGVDSQVRAGDIEVWAEYLRDRFEPTNNLPADRLDADGYYVLALANLTVMERKYQILARYDRFDPDRVIKGDETRTWTVGVNWFLKGWDLVWELNYLLVTAPGTEARGSDDKIISRLQFVF